MKKNKILTIAAVLAITVVVTVYWLAKRPTEKPQLSEVTIHQAAKTLLYLPLYVAVEQGYLGAEGIKARIVTAGGDSQAFAALANGEAQFAQGDPTFVAISHERGGPG